MHASVTASQLPTHHIPSSIHSTSLLILLIPPSLSLPCLPTCFSGLQGIEERLVAPALFEGDVYEAPNLALVPQTLRDSIRLFRDSTFARSVFGQDVVDHYAHFYTTEANAYSRAVTDWERHRYFEQI